MHEDIIPRLKGKVIIVGIGNTLRSDDGAGSLLAGRIKEKVSFTVFDAGESPENYLGKIVREAPDTIVLIDVADFGGKPGEFSFVEATNIKTPGLYSTHNASISLIINYLQSNLKADIILLIIQPKSLDFGDTLSPEVAQVLDKLERWFCEADRKKG
ncbi:MAG: hydrogenase 3 maturation endopeptidase HyCI [Candidatus Omnitrophota bacterium]|jgi:hydrogenase 3 maturation protease